MLALYLACLYCADQTTDNTPAALHATLDVFLPALFLACLYCATQSSDITPTTLHDAGFDDLKLYSYPARPDKALLTVIIMFHCVISDDGLVYVTDA